mgnify:CR=1 FL=1
MCKYFPFGKRFRIHHFKDQNYSCLYKFQICVYNDDIHVKIICENDNVVDILLKQFDFIFAAIGYSIVD